MSMPNCPKCESTYTYHDGSLYVCPECAHEWTEFMMEEAERASKVFDANNNELQDGDDVIVIKDLKVKGSSDAIKQGTKVKGIRLIAEPEDGHDIDCKVDGFGPMKLKSEFVKKA